MATKTTTTTLSTVISTEIKDAITEYCKKKGMKLRYLIENALIEQIEDEMDLQSFKERRNEELFSLENVIKAAKKK